MGKVYAQFKKVCSEIEHIHKDKFPVLRDWLEKEYQTWPPVLQNFTNFHSQVNLENNKSNTYSLLTNPFFPLTGSIENPFGREREIRRIFELLDSGSSVALIGEEAIGKSSILQAVCQQAETKLNPSRKPIYIDLGNIWDEEDFYSDLCHKVGIKKQKGSFLYRALKQYQLLLILDNVEKMAWDGFTNNVRLQLRSLATDGNPPPLRLVVAARTPLDKLFPDSGMVSPFENICQEETIKRWDEMTCRDFIESRLERTSINFTDQEIIELVQKSSGHPQKMMKLCNEVYNSYQQV
jgi:chromosomal replication initiation ATPase DnaA